LVMDTSYVDDARTIDSILGGRKDFPTSGTIRASYKGDRIDIDVDANDDDRILVLNELYHPNWMAYAQGRTLPIFPVNIAMRAILVPKGIRTIEMRYEPFVTSFSGKAISAVGLSLIIGAWIAMCRSTQRQPFSLA